MSRAYISLGRMGKERFIRDGMRMYFSTSQKTGDHGKLIDARPLRILLSYYYFADMDLGRFFEERLGGQPVDIMADSGAFSAWTLGDSVSIDDYAEWLNRWGSMFSCAAALDVIGDPVASREQTDDLRARVTSGVEIVPVFHSNDGGYEHLERIFADGYTYVGISPCGPLYSNPALMRAWLAECFRLRPAGVRYHGFGVTGWRTIREFPFYSVDSSSWAAGFRYANLQLFDEERGTFVKIDMRNKSELLRERRLLERYDLRSSKMRADDYDRTALASALIRSWWGAEEWLRRHHGDAALGGPKPRLVSSQVSNTSPDAIARARALEMIRRQEKNGDEDQSGEGESRASAPEQARSAVGAQTCRVQPAPDASAGDGEVAPKPRGVRVRRTRGCTI